MAPTTSTPVGTNSSASTTPLPGLVDVPEHSLGHVLSQTKHGKRTQRRTAPIQQLHWYETVLIEQLGYALKRFEYTISTPSTPTSLIQQAFKYALSQGTTVSGDGIVSFDLNFEHPVIQVPGRPKLGYSPTIRIMQGEYFLNVTNPAQDRFEYNSKQALLFAQYATLCIDETRMKIEVEIERTSGVMETDDVRMAITKLVRTAEISINVAKAILHASSVRMKPLDNSALIFPDDGVPRMFAFINQLMGARDTDKFDPVPQSKIDPKLITNLTQLTYGDCPTIPDVSEWLTYVQNKCTDLSCLSFDAPGMNKQNHNDMLYLLPNIGDDDGTSNNRSRFEEHAHLSVLATLTYLKDGNNMKFVFEQGYGTTHPSNQGIVISWRMHLAICRLGAFSSLPSYIKKLIHDKPVDEKVDRVVTTLDITTPPSTKLIVSTVSPKNARDSGHFDLAHVRPMWLEMFVVYLCLRVLHCETGVSADDLEITDPTRLPAGYVTTNEYCESVTPFTRIHDAIGDVKYLNHAKDGKN